MNNVSSVVTGGVTLSAATLAPAISWALNGFPHPVPDSVPYLVAAALLTGAHAAYNVISARRSPKQPLALPEPVTGNPSKGERP